ncbi:hypothetical protein LWI28_012008 [Acer negundo]|uniref:DNA polymerase II subunit 2 n=1 Tax=Acer negundo TaxID=4023 RepID=A0AAD5NSX7_ACENE|nr:hypothetical protein LWI28_012008 [Acer negundo]
MSEEEFGLPGNGPIMLPCDAAFMEYALSLIQGCVDRHLQDALVVSIASGFFIENTIVLAEGEMLIDGIFQVINCEFPPLGDRDKSFKLLEGHDIFGGGALTKEETLRLADLEKRAVNDMFVILSDIWLDNEETMGKLEIVLNRFESKEVVPSLSVFMGNFCSHPFNLSFHSFSSLRLQFGKLGQMIAAHPRLKDHS